MHTVHSKARRPRRATEGALFAALDELRSPVGAARSRTGLALGKAPPARGSTRAFVLAGLSTLSSSRYEDNVPALTSPNDHDDRLARAQAREHLEQRNVDLSNGYYWPAAQLLVWGEVQHGRHAEWQDLFYDCILVASAFQIGQFLSHNLKAVEGGLGLVGLGFTTITSWSDLTSYRARFRASSPYHRGLDAVEGLLTALAQHNIVADLAQFEKVNMYTFLTATIATRGVHLLRRVELVLTCAPGSPVRRTHVSSCSRIAGEIVVLGCGFLLNRAASMFLLLISVWVLSMALYAAQSTRKGDYRHSTVPKHIEYWVRRTGEMIMLFLGEGVLALVLSGSPTTLELYTPPPGQSQVAGLADTAARGNFDEREAVELYCGRGCRVELLKGLVSFISAFVLLGGTVYIYYRANPTGAGQRHHHAIRRARRRGWVWNASHWLLAVGLVALSVAFKSMQPYAARPPPREYVMLLAASLASVQPIISVQKLCHPGMRDYIRAPGWAVRLLLFSAKLALAFAPLVMPAFPVDTDGFWFLLFACATSGASACCVMLEKEPRREAALWAFIDASEASAKKQRREAREISLASTVLDSLEHGDSNNNNDSSFSDNHFSSTTGPPDSSAAALDPPRKHEAPTVTSRRPTGAEAAQRSHSLAFGESFSDSYVAELVESEAAAKANAW